MGTREWRCALIERVKYENFCVWAIKNGWFRLSPLLQDNGRLEVWILPNGVVRQVRIFNDETVWNS